MCWESQGASLFRARKVDLLKLGYEHEDWMDEEGARVPRHDKLTPMLPRQEIQNRLAARGANA